MQEIEYLIYLTAELIDRLRVDAQKQKGEILEFIVQYEALISGEWRAIVRYDTFHGFAHKDVIRPDGDTVKQPLFFENYNLAFTFATLDLKANWERYRDNFEKEMKNDKK